MSFLPFFILACSSSPDPTEKVVTDFENQSIDVEIWYSGRLEGEIEPCG